MAIITDGSITIPQQDGRHQEAFPYADDLGDEYARLITRRYQQIGSSFTAPSSARRTNFTNLFTYSEELTNTAWTKTNITAALNITANPENGLVTMGRILETAATDIHRLERAYTFASAANHVLSAFAKYLDREWMRLLANDGTQDYVGWFNLSTGATNATQPDMINATTLNGGFETAGGGGADVLADWEEFPSGTSTVNRDTSVFRSGAASCRFDVDASNSYVAIGQGGLILGKRYKIVAFARNQGGAGEFQIDTGSVYVSGPLTTSFAKHEWEFVATTTSFEVKRGSNAASQSIWIDDVTLTPLDAVELTMTPAPPGGYRCQMNFIPRAAAGLTAYQLSNDGSTLSYAGDTAKGAYLWGLQLESGLTLAGPYIPTTSASRTITSPNFDGIDGDGSAPDPFSFLLTEAPPQESGLAFGMCMFERLYGRIPSTKIEYSTKFFQRPVMHAIKSGTTYAATFDDGVTSHLFSARKTVSSVDALTAPSVAVTKSAAATKSAFTPDTWGSIPVTIKGTGTQLFFTSSPASIIEVMCEAGTGLTVSVAKSNTEIQVQILTGSLSYVEINDNSVELIPQGTTGFTLRRRQTSARIDETSTGAETQTETVISSLRQINVTANGGAAGDWAAFWNGDTLVGIAQVSTASANSFTVPLAGPFAEATLTLTHMQFAKNGTRYVNGLKICTIKRSHYFYLPAVTLNITTGADIPNFTVYSDPVSWLGQIVAAAAYSAIEVSELGFWHGPIYTQTVDEIQMADALDTVAA